VVKQKAREISVRTSERHMWREGEEKERGATTKKGEKRKGNSTVNTDKNGRNERREAAVQYPSRKKK